MTDGKKSKNSPRSREMLIRRAERLQTLEVEFIESDEFCDSSITPEIGKSAASILREPMPAMHDESDVNTHRLLSFAEEQAHFRAMNYLKCRAAKAIETLSSNRPGRKKMDQIEIDLHNAKEIRDRIVLANLRLVISIARRLSSSRIPFEDLVSDGNVILMRAVDKFDYSRGYRFSTYATHAVQRDIFRRFERTTRDSKRFIAGTAEILSGACDESNPPALNLHHHAVYGELVELIEDRLDEREMFIMKARFAIGKDAASKPLKLRSIASELGLSKERVRQLQNRAIKKLQERVQWDASRFDAAAVLADEVLV